MNKSLKKIIFNNIYPPNNVMASNMRFFVQNSIISVRNVTDQRFSSLAFIFNINNNCTHASRNYKVDFSINVTHIINLTTTNCN